MQRECRSEDRELTAEERDLGMDADITRRDFVNAVAVGSGAALLRAGAPSLALAVPAPVRAMRVHPWTGPGGVGDYANANGNTWEVVSAGHGLRDRLYERRIASATETGELYDVAIVGGGLSGTMAAWRFLRDTGRQRTCLILDDHPVPGGEAKRNEFLVRGHRLMGPQGSNQMAVFPTGPFKEIQEDIGMPTSYEFGSLPSSRQPMEFPLDNYLYQYWGDNFENHGYFFDGPRPSWVTNPFAHGLEGTPWPEPIRQDLLRWWKEPFESIRRDDLAQLRWLDTMTVDDYFTKVRKFHPEVARFADPILACAAGPACDVASALVGAWVFSSLRMEQHRLSANLTNAFKVFSFPGGNDGLSRLIIKWLIPDSIEGSVAFADVHNGRIRFEALDQPDRPCRIRLGATVIRVTHDPDTKSQPAVLTYVKNGKVWSVRARTVVWAAAAWSGQYAVARLPEEYRTAMQSFPRAPMMIVNVALDNWRALYRLGYTACSWRGGFGFTGNLRAPMYVGDYRPPLDPDQPSIFTLYVPFPERGLSLAQQGRVARAKLYATPYRAFETQIRHQLVRMFGRAGFDPRKDIAGIVLNRWGHAYVTAGPGFFYGKDGKPPPSDVLRKPLGVVTFAHSELSGHQSAPYCLAEGIRAARQVQELL